MVQPHTEKIYRDERCTTLLAVIVHTHLFLEACGSFIQSPGQALDLPLQPGGLGRQPVALRACRAAFLLGRAGRCSVPGRVVPRGRRLCQSLSQPLPRLLRFPLGLWTLCCFLDLSLAGRGLCPEWVSGEPVGEMPW